MGSLSWLISFVVVSGFAVFVLVYVALVVLEPRGSGQGQHLARPRRRQTRGLCPECGYDLRASPGRCPECGRDNSDLDRFD